MGTPASDIKSRSQDMQQKAKQIQEQIKKEMEKHHKDAYDRAMKGVM